MLRGFARTITAPPVCDRGALALGGGGEGMFEITDQKEPIKCPSGRPPHALFNVQRSLKDWPSADERISSAAPDQGISICRDGRVIDLQNTSARLAWLCSRCTSIHPGYVDVNGSWFHCTFRLVAVALRSAWVGRRVWPLTAFFGTLIDDPAVDHSPLL